MSDDENALSEALADLRNKALSSTVDPAMAVSALIGAAADILCLTFPPEVVVSLMIASTNDALRAVTPDLLTISPAGSA